MSTSKIEGQLEIDHQRGVIYFHAKKTGSTLLRICSLPKPIPQDRHLDVTARDAICNWKNTEEQAHPTYKCDNCGKRYADDDERIAMDKIKDLSMRVDPGCEVPAGECPECGALVYLEK